MGKYIMVWLKGIAMGAADVVPGVSGGTIAFITGIYGELLESIKSLDLTAARLLFTGHFRRFWTKINGTFLFSLILGIASSIFMLAMLMTWLLENEPIATWSFFLGLILASALLVARQVGRWNAWPAVFLAAGIATGYIVPALNPAADIADPAKWFIILSGAIAICAMILPGISGSFILVLLGMYNFVMTAIDNLRIDDIALFGIGAAAGIISFSHLLSWLLKKHNDIVVALLMGFMLGSLNKVWPWKYDGGNIFPGRYEELCGDAHLAQAIIWGMAGFMLIFGIEYLGRLIAKRRA